MAQYVRHTLDTKYQVDFDWWQAEGKSLRVMLASHLCPACRNEHANDAPSLMDWIDPQTGEVKQVDVLWHTLHSCCSQQNDYITPQTPLTTAVFLAFIANDNAPMTPVELHQMLAPRSADLILRTIGGKQVYYGVKPVTTGTRRRSRLIV